METKPPPVTVRGYGPESRRTSYDSFSRLRERAESRRLRQGLLVLASLAGLAVLFVLFARTLSS